MGQAVRNSISSKRIALLLALVHWLSSFFTERLILTVSPMAHAVDYALCKLILLVALVLFWDFVIRIFQSRESRRTAMYALPYLLVLILWLFLRHPFVLEADELNLFTRATELDCFAYWFNYFSGYYWIICLMLLPFPMGPVFIKLLLQALVVGYCLNRQRNHSGKWATLLLYLPFLLPFVLDLGLSAHRLPLYGMLYLFLAAKLFYDHKERRTLDRKTLVLLSVIIAVLAFWRTEGIYLTVFGAGLILIAYRIPLRKNWKKLWKKALCYGLILLLVALPQLSAYTNAPAPLSLRTKPLCGYALSNMLRCGLAVEEISAEDYAAIDAYLPMEQVLAFNERRGDSGFAQADVMELVRPDIDYPTQEKFCNAVKHLILSHPFLYLKSQLLAFDYTSRQYPLTGDLKNTLLYCSYRQWLPLILCFVFFLYSLLRKRWMTLALSFCALCNWALVTALMPAAYAKYFYVDYLMGWFLLFVGLSCLLSRRKEQIYD